MGYNAKCNTTGDTFEMSTAKRGGGRKQRENGGCVRSPDEDGAYASTIACVIGQFCGLSFLPTAINMTSSKRIKKCSKMALVTE